MAAKAKEASRAPSCLAMLEQAPRILSAIRRKETIYMGACVVQAPGAWTRCGPTWYTPGIGWTVVGPGVARWGTTEGLAQLASAPTASPQWHADGVAVVPDPNLVFGVHADTLAAPYMARVKELADGAIEVLR